MRCPLRIVASLVILFLCPGASAADMVLQWNIYLRETMKRDSLTANPGWSTRALAMMNGAIYDSFQAIHRTHEPFHVDATAPATASRAAAATEAAYRVLAQLYPAESSWLSWAYGYSLSLIPSGQAKTDGVALGSAVATEYLAWREADGASGSVPYTPSNEPGKWRPDPLNPTQVAWGPGWGTVRTFALDTSSQFQPPPAPALTSAEYTAAWQEVMAYGAKVSAVRSDDQLQVGLFWAYDRSGLGPPPVLFSRNLHEIAVQQANTEEQNARLFALASVAMADAAIACWDAKFTGDVWRPITGIREADTDGNPATTAQPNWEPYGAPGGEIVPNFTPPFPSYVSGHASMGEAAFVALKAFYGRNDVAFHLTSDEVPGVVRHYTTFSQAAQENADSRVWLGVHWRFDQTEGQKLGAEIAAYLSGHFFEPVVRPGEDMLCDLNGPDPATGYTMVQKNGPYDYNGRLDVRIGASFLLQITPAMSFTPLVCAGALTGIPSNVSAGRLATADGFGTLRFTANAQSFVLDDFQMTPGMVETFADFAATHVLSGDPAADADGDGVTDFNEYAFDTQPKTFDQPPAARLETMQGQQALVVRYVRRAGRLLAGLVIEAQGSVDLADWNTSDVVDEIDPDSPTVPGAEPRRARIPVPASGQIFLRLWAQR